MKEEMEKKEKERKERALREKMIRKGYVYEEKSGNYVKYENDNDDDEYDKKSEDYDFNNNNNEYYKKSGNDNNDRYNDKNDLHRRSFDYLYSKARKVYVCPKYYEKNCSVCKSNSKGIHSIYIELYAHKKCCPDKERNTCVVCRRDLIGHCYSGRCCKNCIKKYNDVKSNFCVICCNKFI